MQLPLQIFLLLFNILNIAFHGIGVYALASLYKRSKHKPQRLYIVSLSTSEVLINFLEIFRNLTEMVHVPPEINPTVSKLKVYTKICIFTGVSCVYYFDMLMLTADRLLSVILGLRYPSIWTETRAKYLLVGTWVMGLSVCLAFCLAVGIGKWDSDIIVSSFYTYVYPPMELLFLLLAISTYSYIFCKRSKSVHQLSTMSQVDTRTSEKGTSTNEEQRLRKEKKRTPFNRPVKAFFLVPSLLIVTFVLFMVIPDLTYLFFIIVEQKPGEILTIICLISYSVSHFTDACIYIFFLKDVRRFLLIKMRLRKDSVYLRQISTMTSTIRRRARESGINTTHLLQPAVAVEMTCSDESFSAVDKEIVT